MPFVYPLPNGVTYNYCADIDGKLQCQTSTDSENPEYDDCNNSKNINNYNISKIQLYFFYKIRILGKFLQSYSKSGDKYDSDAEFEIKVQQLGTYEISFQAIMYCDSGDDCVEAGDFLKVGARFDSRATFRNLAEFKITDFEEQNKWELKTIPDFIVDTESEKDFTV